MRDEPPDAVTAARRGELAALRLRAYAPGGDIDSDPAALAQLDELEELIRIERLRRTAPPVADSTIVPEAESTTPSAGPGQAAAAAASTPTERRPDHPAPPRHRRFAVAAGAVAVAVALVLAGALWGMKRPSDAPAPATIPPMDDEYWSTSSQAGYALYLDTLRGELLAGPGMKQLAGRLIRTSLRPYGSLYGRTVWAGSTTDAEYCMIVEDTPAPAIVCGPIDPAYAAAQSVVLPVRYAQDGIESSVSITYTLLASGNVVARPPDVALP